MAASVAARLTDRGLPNIFRVCGRDDDQARLSAAVLAERFRDRKIALIQDQTPAARSLAAARLMGALGYERCFNVTDGFEGPPDGAGHRGTVAGWKASGLPWRQT